MTATSYRTDNEMGYRPFPKVTAGAFGAGGATRDKPMHLLARLLLQGTPNTDGTLYGSAAVVLPTPGAPGAHMSAVYLYTSLHRVPGVHALGWAAEAAWVMGAAEATAGMGAAEAAGDA